MGQSQSNETFVSNGTGGISSPNAFETLVSNLSIQLGPSNGLDVDIDELTTLMEEYSSSESEWSKYALKDLRRGYTRNLVDVGNGKSNLLILVWSPGKGSPIHDHANAHCLMRILKGSLKETRYSLPGSLNSPLIITKETWYTEGQVTYMSDELGLHKITNADPDNVTVSLHLYTPPNATREGCNVFNEMTGKRTHVTQSNYYSRYGQKSIVRINGVNGHT